MDRILRGSPWAAVLMPAAALAVLLLAGGAAAARAQACPPVGVKEDLRTIPALTSKLVPGLGPVLDTTFTVRMESLCIPVKQSNGTYAGKRVPLRTYVYPDPATGKPTWGYTDKNGQKWVSPGPTLHLNKPSTPRGRGDRLWVKLVNDLPITSNLCESACSAGAPKCPSSTSQLPTPATCTATPTTPLCCCWVDLQQKTPDCFHGSNVTNLHFHGTHVSPQAPQDYVLLELYPQPVGRKRPADVHPAHVGGTVEFGEYQYKVDPLPWTQPEGTHWYHPHKHGSVALQVANGMAGALLIDGPFDAWLRSLYGGKLVEKLLVLQQIQQNTNLFAQGGAPPLLVNGQVDPKITLAPGEIQRWRFVNATIQSSAQVVISFPATWKVLQIAQDGVQFAPENYRDQPLFSPTNPGDFKISPGNRADFLVQAPSGPTLGLAARKAVEFPVTHRVFGAVGPRARQEVQLREQGLRALTATAAAAAPPLFSPMVAPVAPVNMKFPDWTQWPKFKDCCPYLLDIGQAELTGPPQNLTFSMSQTPGGPASVQGDPATMFFLNNRQYKPDCENVTTKLETASAWTIQNASGTLHPFHIHTNPFQVISDNSLAKPLRPPWIWWDTYALPVAKGTTPGRVEMWQRYTEFTGAYVLHCHFLGHEDRGMMFGVQTVCKNSPSNFGKARSDGQPECVTGNFTPAFDMCK
jgi:FtsP/CotA-like multicopper oxidase with cupredoxin domain